MVAWWPNFLPQNDSGRYLCGCIYFHCQVGRCDLTDAIVFITNERLTRPRGPVAPRLAVFLKEKRPDLGVLLVGLQFQRCHPRLSGKIVTYVEVPNLD